jgi:hypothetical protein
LSLKCTSDDCDYDRDTDEISIIPYHPQKDHRPKNNSERSNSPRAADFEENVRLVISMQMNGCGGEDAAAVLGMLNMPGGARMRHTHFMAIEQEIAITEIDVAEEAIRGSKLQAWYPKRRQ